SLEARRHGEKPRRGPPAHPSRALHLGGRLPRAARGRQGQDLRGGDGPGGHQPGAADPRRRRLWTRPAARADGAGRAHVRHRRRDGRDDWQPDRGSHPARAGRLSPLGIRAESPVAEFVIEGRTRTKGKVRPGGNKNAAFPAVAAALLTSDPAPLRNLPDIDDVRTLLAMVAGLGVDITRRDRHTVTLRAGTLRGTRPDPELLRKIRGALVLMGPLLPRARRA